MLSLFLSKSSITLFMKKSLFLASVLVLLSSFHASADVHTVDSAAAFATAWNNLNAGDSIQINQDINLAAAGALATHDFTVELVSENGSSFTWIGNTNSPLPANVIYKGVMVAGSPQVVLAGKNVIIGSGNSFISNNDGVVLTDGVIEIKPGNDFDSNVSSSDGGAIAVREGGTLKIEGGNRFSNNMAIGRGGAISIADSGVALPSGSYSAVLDATTADIVFENNAEEVVIAGGNIVSSGFANDLYLGKNASVNMVAGEGNQIDLASGIASSDASARIVKNGTGDMLVGDAEFYAGAVDVMEGRVLLAENRSWGDGSSNAVIQVAPDSAFVLQKGSTLSQNIKLAGGSLVVHQGAVLNSALSATSRSAITFVLTPESVLQSSISSSPWLTIAPGGTLTQAAAAHLTLNLDVTSFSNSVIPAGELFAVDFSNSGDAVTPNAVRNLTITYTDTKGVHRTNLTIDEDGMVDISGILENIDWKPIADAAMVTGTNSMLSSLGTLAWLREAATGNSLNVSPIQTSSCVWGAGMGGTVNHSGNSSDYDYSGIGYSVGIENKIAPDTYVGVAFAQSFGSGDSDCKMAADAGASVDQEAIMMGIYARHIRNTKTGNNVIDLFAGYSSVENDLSSSRGKADWNDDVFTLAVRSTWNWRISESACLSPFIALEYSTVSQGSYTICGNRYLNGEASLLSMPIGVALSNRFTECSQKSITPYVSAAVVPHLTADDPEADVATPDGGSSCSKGIGFESCSFRLHGGIRVEWNDQWSTDISASFQTDSSQTSGRLNATASYAF